MPLTIGARIKILRKRAGMTQAQLAAKAHYDQGQLSRIENDANQLGGVHSLRRIARAIGCTIDDIVIGTALLEKDEKVSKEKK